MKIFGKLAEMMWFGLRCRCPRCGQGRLFDKWYDLRDACGECELPFEPEPGATWAVMYLSVAFMTGLFIAAMLLIRPSNIWLGRIVLAIVAPIVLIGSLPRRKGLAIALDHYARTKLEGV